MILIIIIIWTASGWYYSNTNYFKGIFNNPLFVDNIKINSKAIFDFIVILPLFIFLVTIIYTVSFFAILFKCWDLCEDVMDITYRFMPNFLKKKWLLHLSEPDKGYIASYMEYTPAKLQEIIIDFFIKNEFNFDEYYFNLIKTDMLKWKYLDSKFHRELLTYEKEWLVEFTVSERERKINQILDLD